MAVRVGLRLATALSRTVFELHVRQCPLHRADEDPPSDGASTRERRLEVDAYFSFPVFRPTAAATPDPRPADCSGMSRAAPRRRILRQALLFAVLVLAIALWPNGCTSPFVEPSCLISRADPAVISAGTDPSKVSGTVFGCSLSATDCLLPKITILFPFAVLLLRPSLWRRPMFRLRVYLLHPEAPAPFPTPRLNRSRYIDIALRMTDPGMWIDFEPRTSAVRFYTDPNGSPPPDSSRDLFGLCLRLLRYAFLSRLPRLAHSAVTAGAQADALRQDPSSLGGPKYVAAEQVGPRIPAPAADTSPAEQADYAFRLAVYAHQLELRLYLALVLSAVLYGFLFGFGPTSKVLAVFFGLVWLYFSISRMLKQVRAFSRWLHRADKEPWPPAYELNHERRWRDIWPDYFRQNSDAEVGIGHDRLLAVAVTVLFALYLTLLQVIV